MAFIDELLDEEVAYGFEGGPEYNTTVIDLENSLEQRDSKWKYAKHKYSATFDNLTDEAKETIIRVFHACRGRRHAFMFKDWNDYQAAAEPIVVPTGTSDPIQLYKTYNFGEAYTVRVVQAVNSNTRIRDVDNNIVAGTLDTATGMFTPADDWEAGQHTWSGDFYVWVRFQDDYNSFTINSWQASTAQVDLLEDKRDVTAENVPDSWEE